MYKGNVTSNKEVEGNEEPMTVPDKIEEIKQKIKTENKAT